MTTYRESKKAKCQHEKPCHDCPWRRVALRGWLGTYSAEQWVHIAHRDDKVECHALRGAQCAGIAIYRANVAKSPRNPTVLRLKPDHKLVFSGPMEFIEYHTRGSKRDK